MRGKIQKKLKEKKMEFLDKLPSFIEKHEYLAIVENTDISSALINKMRAEIENADILFVKKKMLNKKYKIVNDEKNNFNDKNFFLVFTNTKGLEDLKKYKYETFLDCNDVSTKDIVINKGQIKNKELAELLPTITEKNITMLEEDFPVCLKGDKITEKQVQLLRLLKHKLKEEPIRILQVYETKDINKLE